MLIVTSHDERLLAADNVMQNEIQELRTKVSALEQKVASLESKSGKPLNIYIL
jgi:polyhydroxyalkanoate synthesis regulator phasin